jgi:hypothetical protein
LRFPLSSNSLPLTFIHGLLTLSKYLSLVAVAGFRATITATKSFIDEHFTSAFKETKALYNKDQLNECITKPPSISKIPPYLDTTV